MMDDQLRSLTPGVVVVVVDLDDLLIYFHGLVE